MDTQNIVSFQIIQWFNILWKVSWLHGRSGCSAFHKPDHQWGHSHRDKAPCLMALSVLMPICTWCLNSRCCSGSTKAKNLDTWESTFNAQLLSLKHILMSPKAHLHSQAEVAEIAPWLCSVLWQNIWNKQRRNKQNIVFTDINAVTGPTCLGRTLWLTEPMEAVCHFSVDSKQWGE